MGEECDYYAVVCHSSSRKIRLGQGCRTTIICTCADLQSFMSGGAGFAVAVELAFRRRTAVQRCHGLLLSVSGNGSGNGREMAARHSFIMT